MTIGSCFKVARIFLHLFTSSAPAAAVSDRSQSCINACMSLRTIFWRERKITVNYYMILSCICWIIARQSFFLPRAVWWCHSRLRHATRAKSTLDSFWNTPEQNHKMESVAFTFEHKTSYALRNVTKLSFAFLWKPLLSCERRDLRPTLINAEIKFRGKTINWSIDQIRPQISPFMWKQWLSDENTW